MNQSRALHIFDRRYVAPRERSEHSLNRVVAAKAARRTLLRLRCKLEDPGSKEKPESPLNTEAMINSVGKKRLRYCTF